MKRMLVTTVTAVTAATALLPGGNAGAKQAAQPNHTAVLRAALEPTHARAGDLFGTSVAISGRTLVVGAPARTVAHHRAQGAVYVFTRGRGGWSHATQQAELVAPNGHAGDSLGVSVAVSGRTIVAGAPYRTNGQNTYQGASYVWTKTSGGWAQTPRRGTELQQTDGNSVSRFGISVSVSHGVAVVGAPGEIVGFHGSQGAAYVFTGLHRRGAPIHPRAKLVAAEGNTRDEMGTAVSIDNTTVLAGAPFHKSTKVASGAAFVFTKGASGWKDATETAMLTARDGARKDYLGYGVALSGKTIVLDAPNRDVGSNRKQGAAYVYTQPTAGWQSTTQQAKLTVKPGAPKVFSGAGIGISGRSVVISGYGLASIFVRPRAGWSGVRHQKAALVGQGAGQFIGRTVAMSGRTIAAGAPYATIDNRPQEGTAFVYVK